MSRTPVYIICSPRPQVGKTLLARLATEFLLLAYGDVTAFDVNLKEPTLLDYLPHVTETAEIGDTAGKVAMMDRLILDDGVPKVIDLGYHAFDEFFRTIAEIGFIKEATRRGVAPIVLFVADADRVSVRAFGEVAAALPARALAVVDNEHVLRGELPAAFGGGRIVPIRALPSFLGKYIERTTFSFTGYLRGEKDASTELNQWIRANYTQFRDIALMLSGARR